MSVSTDLQVPLGEISVVKDSGSRDATACCVILGVSLPCLDLCFFTWKDKTLLFANVTMGLLKGALA